MNTDITEPVIDTEPTWTAGGRCIFEPVPQPDELRKQMVETGQPQADLAEADQTWTTEQLQADFDVLGFAAPFVVVRRKSDGAKGSLEFVHAPRRYFGWSPA
jgi:hypothetical protein